MNDDPPGLWRISRLSNKSTTNLWWIPGCRIDHRVAN
jgi:hypothetical protein